MALNTNGYVFSVLAKNAKHGLSLIHISMDRNTPRLDLIGIFHRDDLVSIIRERVETNKRKKGIYEITNH